MKFDVIVIGGGPGELSVQKNFEEMVRKLH